MRHWSFYTAHDGLFTGQIFSAPDNFLSYRIAKNTPQGCVAIEGRFDHLCQRVDLSGDGDVVDYQPPAPDDKHEWNSDSKRWVLRQEVAQARAIIAASHAEIQEIEKSGLRSMREALLSLLDPESEAAKRLAQSDERVAALRASLKT